MQGERDLLFGVLALQSGLIDPGQFAEACNRWAMKRSGSISEVLVEKGWIEPDDCEHVEYLVRRKLAKHGGDPRASLITSSPEVRQALASIDDADVRRSLAPEGEATPQTIDLSAPRMGERYQLDRLHAAGGIGEIWLARDNDLDRDVALKRLRASKSGSNIARMRFLREARLTGRLDHPGVVPVYEVCLDRKTGLPYYTMRFLKGRSLTEAVKQYHTRREAGGANTRELITLLNAFVIVCNTVAYAHSKGIIHRDLKSDNVLLGDFGEVVVVDWGLAKEVERDGTALRGIEIDSAALESSDPVTTIAGHILGTPAYMAPEQASGRVDLIGPATDVYGLCAILYEILCGRPPFLGSNLSDLLRRVREEPSIPPSEVVPEVPEPLEEICLRGLSKSPARRQRSADELARSVQRWLGDLAERSRVQEIREHFFGLSLDPLAIIDDQGKLSQVSPAWEHLLGSGADELLNREFIGLIHPEDRDAAGRALRHASAECEATLESRFIARDGSHRWISWNLTPLRKERCVCIVGRDVTELKRSEQKLQGLLESAPDGFVIVDAAGLITLVNSQAERIFGYPRDELLGQSVELLIPERFRETHPRQRAEYSRAPVTRPIGRGRKLVGRRKDGSEVPVEVGLSPVQTEEGLLIFSVVRDLSERRGPEVFDEFSRLQH